MTEVKSQAVTIERRTFLKLAAAAAVTGAIVDCEMAFAADATSAANLPVLMDGVLKATAQDAGQEFLYWIDGPMNTGLKSGFSSDLATRARLACTMAIDHGQNNTYLESVTLVEISGATKTILQQVIHGSKVQTVSKRAPYTIFENLYLDLNKSYQLIFVKSSNNTVTIYQHTITSPRASRMDYKHLPFYSSVVGMARHFFKNVIQELQDGGSYYFTDAQEDSRGLVTTPFGVTLAQDLSNPHSCRARVLKIGTDGDFEIEVEFMHGDTSSDAHYMRYFLVMDPVGRILGAVRRMHNDGVTQKVLVKRGYHTPLSSAPTGEVLKYTYNGKNYYRMQGEIKGVDIPEFDDLDKQNYIQNLSILDCPYVSIYTDDVFHAIARFTLRLR